MKTDTIFMTKNLFIEKISLFKENRKSFIMCTNIFAFHVRTFVYTTRIQTGERVIYVA